MDPEIDELKGLIQQNLAIAKETNNILRGMRRSARWGRFFQVAWWVIIIAVSWATYYLYLQPYVTSIEKVYGSTQNFETQLQNVFKNLGSSQTSTQAQ